MRKILLVGVAALMLAWPTLVAAALCWIENHDSYAARLLGAYGELPVFIGSQTFADADDVRWRVEVFAHPKGKTWTVVAYSRQTNQFCLLASGQAWSRDQEI